MFQLHRPRNAEAEKGFTLMEVMVALVVLTIGLMSAAALMATVYRTTVRSRYVAVATQLASEELEDLNRWPVVTTNGVVTSIDPHILVPAGANTCGAAGVTCVGSLTTDWNQTITDMSGNTTPISYFDTVSLSTQNGLMSETYKMPCTGGNYQTITYSPSGQTPALSCSPNPPTMGMTFDRRWVIEQDQPVAGVRRITVLVILDDKTVQPPVTFQMSLVRP